MHRKSDFQEKEGHLYRKKILRGFANEWVHLNVTSQTLPLPNKSLTPKHRAEFSECLLPSEDAQDSAKNKWGC